PVWAMAFRPFYLLAALYGALSVLLWGFGYQGTAALPAQFWHAHEMIWGYAGLVVVAFLLTAVATWTRQPPVSGERLMILTAFWLGARLTVFLPHTALPSGLLGTAFYLLAAYFMGESVVRSKNTRNYIAVAALALFGLSLLAFHLAVAAGSNLTGALHAGLLMVAGFIGFIGTRIISFFTSRRLSTAQAPVKPWMATAPLYLPAAAAVLTALGILPLLASLCCLAAGALALYQGFRWHEKGIWREPLLWILHVGYALTALGLIVYGISGAQLQWQSLGIHLIAVGGIGLLTIGMMSRTALGHTGQMLYPLPKPMGTAFLLMAAAALFRALAAVMLSINATAYQHSLRLSAALFAASLLMFFWRYAPWLTAPRKDGMPG
ncbi:MAG: NnrS family protein, partial [Neisseria sp.]|nr:NnrS family protein [Neisseria sp.]